MDAQERINRAIYANPGSVHWLARLEGFVDEGERAAYESIVEEIRGSSILDLGIGGGRTTALLSPIASRYTALDYLPEMVAAARRKNPLADIQQGDARDLSRFDDGTFKLVLFSYAGIDSINHEGRLRVIQEVSRVLQPGGIFWFSTLNMDGGTPRERPWIPERSSRRGAVGVLRTGRDMVVSVINYARLRRKQVRGNGWQVAPFSAYSYGMLAHYTTLEHQTMELGAAGFEGTTTVFDGRGNLVRPGDDLRCIDFFNIVARKLA